MDTHTIEHAISVQALSKTVATPEGALKILDDINFKVLVGETVAIVGASGSGKSTLLSLLAGLDTPSQGTVSWNGTEIFAFDEESRAQLRARSLGFVFQSFQLLGHLTALENVMLPIELQGGKQAAERARGMLAEVGLAERLHHYPKTMSGGEQQRVALARAFVNAPALLFADEPTGSLDSATGQAIIDLMFRMNRDHGATLVLVTHDLEVAARCGRRLLMQAGRLTEAH